MIKRNNEVLYSPQYLKRYDRLIKNDSVGNSRKLNYTMTTEVKMLIKTGIITGRKL